MPSVAIDGDILLYRCGFAAQEGRGEEAIPEPVANAFHNVKTVIQNILSLTNATEYKIFLSGKDNFRYQVDPDYKISRKDAEKPIHYQALKEYMLAYHPTEVIDGMEADDALGIWLYEEGKHDNPEQCSRVMASIDKDLDQVPGWHCNFVKNRVYWVDKDYGEYVYLRQLLTGDRTDDIPGILGMGDKKADDYLGNYSSFEEAFRRVQSAYLVWIPDLKEAQKRLHQNMNLLYIRRMQGEGIIEAPQWPEDIEPADFTQKPKKNGGYSIVFGDKEKAKQKAEKAARENFFNV